MRVTEYPRWAEPLRDQLPANVERLAAKNGLTIEHIRKTKTSREEYFYFIDEQLGLCFAWVPTWGAFRMQIYTNGRNWLAAEMCKGGNRFDIRIQSTRIKLTMGPVSIKMCDKFGLLLRIETTVNDVTFFPH